MKASVSVADASLTGSVTVVQNIEYYFIFLHKEEVFN
jgi:hypothetical protein